MVAADDLQPGHVCVMRDRESMLAYIHHVSQSALRDWDVSAVQHVEQHRWLPAFLISMLISNHITVVVEWCRAAVSAGSAV